MERATFRIKRFLHRHQRKVKIASISLGVLCAVFILMGAVFIGTVTSGLPDVSKLDRYDPAQTTRIFSRDGTLVATLFDQNRTPVETADISEPMKQAIVAIEDRRFFEHEGVDYRGILRAAFGNFFSGEVQQGASTLTMQLARRLFLDDDRTYSRKLREAVLANRIDRTLSKEKILELYLNEVYFGAGAYGIDAAASVYFSVNPRDLNLWQSALLAGLVQAPSAYSPIEDKPAALKRMDEVLQALETEKKITAQQREQANLAASEYEFKNRSLKLSDGMLKYPYFTTYAAKQLFEMFPENYVRRGGLQVYTTLDIGLQEAAESALAQEVEGPGKQMGADAGAVVVLDNNTGEILAMVGGTEWDQENQFNRAWQARRQPGSSFKMFVYAAGLEYGFTPETELADTEATFSYDTVPWTPSNSDGKFMGPIPLRTGLQFSRNVVAAKVMAHVGPSRVISLAHRMGITAELPEVTSLALGAGEISPLEMARAFSVLPNGGALKENHVLLKVTDADGELIEDFSAREAGERVLSNRTATVMCEMLRRVVTGGTATQANIPGTFVAGKTGTTDKFIDAWFVGFTPYHTISVWIGRDDNKPMGRVYGGTLPAHVFRRVAEHGLTGQSGAASLPGVTFDQGQTVELCWDSSYLALPGCTKTYRDSFSAGVVPARECPMHRVVKKKVIKKEDGTLTNLGEDGLAVDTALGDDGLTVESTPNAAQATAKLKDPRKDPEVVTPAGAIIPYKEKQPESGVEVVEIKVQKSYPTVDDETDPETDFLTDGEGGLIRVTEDPSSDIVKVEVEQSSPSSYPKAGEPESSYPSSGEESAVPAEDGTEDPAQEGTEVIYTNQDLEIPPDTVEK